MANAALQNTGRSVVAERTEGMAERGNARPVRFTVKLVYRETAEQRRTRHARETGTSKGLWK